MVYTVKTRRSILAFLFAFNIVNISFESEGSSKYLFYFRVTHYTPKTIIAELLDFADKEEIPVLKTRDFVILEK